MNDGKYCFFKYTHNVRESNEGYKVVALVLEHFIFQIFFMQCRGFSSVNVLWYHWREYKDYRRGCHRSLY